MKKTKKAKDKKLYTTTLVVYVVFLIIVVVLAKFVFLYKQKENLVVQGLQQCQNDISEKEKKIQACNFEKSGDTMGLNWEIGRLNGIISAKEKGIEILRLSQTEKNKLERFEDETIGIIFDYPEYWGPVTVGTEHPGSMKTIWFSGLNSQIVLAASDPYDPPDGRGGYFGDVGYSITSTDMIRNYCDDKQDCDVFKNSYGIEVARHFFITGTEGGDESEDGTYQYYLHNPNSLFQGVAISPARIPTRFYIEDFDEVFEDVVMSIRFIQ